MTDTEKLSIQFDMVKSNLFRVVYAEGAWGGVSPRGDIVFALYNERQALPQITKQDLVEAEGGLAAAGPEEIVVRKPGLVREVEVHVVMNLNSAMAFHEWLGQKIAEHPASIAKAAEVKAEK